MHQIFHLARFNMPPGAELGVEQFIVDFHLKLPDGGGDEREGLDAGFERLEQFSRQTGGARGVVSNRAVFDSDDHSICSNINWREL